MHRYGEHWNIAFCMLKREQGLLQVGQRRAFYHFGEDLAACHVNKAVKCDLPDTSRSTYLVVFSPDRQKIASAHGDHNVRIIDSNSGRCLQTLEGHPRTPWTLSFHPSTPDLLASGCLKGVVHVWNIVKGTSVTFCSPQSTSITSLAFHPTDSVLLIATGNRLFFWNWDQPTPFLTIESPSEQEKVHLVKFDLLGHHILTGVRNLFTPSSNATSWDVRTKVRHNTVEHGNRLSPDCSQPTAASVFRHGIGMTGPRRDGGSERVSNYSTVSHSESRSLSSTVSTSHTARELQMSSPGSTAASANSDGYVSQRAPRACESALGPGSRPSSTPSPHNREGVIATTSLPQVETTVNHAIADVLAQHEKLAMAANFTSTTYRLQWWDFTKLEMPKLQEGNLNVVVKRCKLHNDTSIDISADGRLLAAFVSSVTGIVGRVCVFSLENSNLGQCLCAREFNPNAVSLSFSPLARYLLVGLATIKTVYRAANSPIMQILECSAVNGSLEDMMMQPVSYLPVKYLYPNTRTSSINTAVWHPSVGCGLVYGTTLGKVFLCQS